MIQLMDKNLAPVGMVNIVILHRILFLHQLAKVGIMSMNLAGKEIAPPRIACKAFNCAIHLADGTGAAMGTLVASCPRPA